MSAEIPIDSKGRRTKSATDFALAKRTAWTTTNDPYGRYINVAPTGGMAAADGSVMPYFIGSGIMNALAIQSGKSEAQKNAEVTSYGMFVRGYSGSPGDLEEAQDWVDMANAVVPGSVVLTSFTLASVASDSVLGKQPRNNVTVSV